MAITEHLAAMISSLASTETTPWYLQGIEGVKESSQWQSLATETDETHSSYLVSDWNANPGPELSRAGSSGRLVDRAEAIRRTGTYLSSIDDEWRKLVLSTGSPQSQWQVGGTRWTPCTKATIDWCSSRSPAFVPLRSSLLLKAHQWIICLKPACTKEVKRTLRLRNDLRDQP